MKKLHANLALAAERLGWPGVVGLGLLAFVAGFYFSTVRPAQIRVAQLNGEAHRLARERARPVDDAPASTREQLDAFYRFFPPSDQTSVPLGKIFAVARKQRLGLVQGEYRILRESASGLTRYQLTFPLKGTYPQVRRFVAAALAEVPNLLLDSVQFERRKIGESVVNARVKFVMYLGRTT